ncbi:nucleoporin-interacting protein [Halalkalibacter urbisdiaboli]|uniref:nucleoporin-interacting protein n=1 Tax=Halalkalibacter urbisdiaboli TaxID=1960589 RepID=UPI000B43105D|nr:nucleoporin-interacting protein [Halalkalibacter urbisdiaboli]
MRNIWYKNQTITLLVVIALIFLYYYRLVYLYPFAATWDQVDFVLALGDFDLLKMQPHFPGYPYFILGGLLFAKAFNFGPESLSIFNHTMVLSSCIPVYLLAREWVSHRQSLLVVLAVQSLSYSTVMIAQPMSEGAALAVVFWFLWSIVFAYKKDSLFIDLLPFFLFSFLLGIRLSYIAFGIGLAFHIYHIWRRNSRFKTIQVVIYLLFMLLFQLAWVGALAVNTGGFETLWNVAIGFSEGHFTEWGGTAGQGAPLVERLITILFINIIWVGLLTENMILMGLFIVISILLVYQRKSVLRQNRLFPYYLILTSTTCYFLWALFAQNLEKPRHILPIALLLMFFIAVQTKKKSMICLLCLWIVIHSYHGFRLLEKQATELPAVYQLEQDLRGIEDTVVYTWEETRIFEYLQSPFSHKRVYSYDKFKHEVELNKNKTIYLTGHVIKGFEQQGADMSAHVRKIKVYTSDPLFDPVYGQIELYEWID